MDIDINLVSHAKKYIDDLAKGINPFSKEEINENDIVNNIKISRCLFYVSDILEQVIDNGGVGNKKAIKPKLDEIDTAMIPLEQFNYSSEPVSITVITRKINDLIPDNMKKLRVTAITNWLTDINLLQIVTIDGKNYKQPTANATEFGITMERREGMYGIYDAVLYNDNAQHFIVDNITSIIEAGYNKRKKKSV